MATLTTLVQICMCEVSQCLTNYYHAHKIIPTVRSVVYFKYICVCVFVWKHCDRKDAFWGERGGVTWSVITYCKAEESGEDQDSELPCGPHQKDTSAPVHTDPGGDGKQSAKQPTKHAIEINGV